MEEGDEFVSKEIGALWKFNLDVMSAVGKYIAAMEEPSSKEDFFLVYAVVDAVEPIKKRIAGYMKSMKGATPEICKQIDKSFS